MTEGDFACRMLGISDLVREWMVTQVIMRGFSSQEIHPEHAKSYLTQVRRKLDEIEKEFCP